AHACNGTPTLLVQSGAYPAGYAQTCADLAKALCVKGGSCSPDAGNGACCIVRPNGRSCPEPEWYCEVYANNGICGDATLDPSAAPACAQAIPQATCASNQPGVQLPATCPFLD